MSQASRVFRDAASSSGLLTTQHIRATSEAEKYTKALQKQKLTMGDMIKHQGIMRDVYRDQLRMQRMFTQHWGTDAAGRTVTDLAIPRSVPKDLDNMRRRMGFFGQMAASAGTQVVNLGKNIQWSGRQLTVGLTYPMVMFGAAAGVMAYKVEDAFASINKVYDVSAKAMTNDAQRAKELNDVRVMSMEEARKAADKYGATITDTLKVEQALAATGLTGKKLTQSVDEVQRISRLGDIEAGQTTDMVVALQTAFRSTIKDSADLTDTLNYMNAASNATSLSLQDIAEATPRAASAMAALGVNAKEMTVLLVSMRESGVDAAEGANALKSATSAILAPSPAALKFIKQIAGGEIAKGFENIAKTSGGSLYKAMGEIFRLTEGLSSLERQQIITKFFGRYQFNRVSAMVSNLGAAFDDTTGKVNQTSKAMALMGNSAKDNAALAANSLDAMINTPAGKFKRAWAGIQIELAEMGKPFLAAAADFLSAVTDIIGGFNDLDPRLKKLAGYGAAVLALAGPFIMVAGLVMNLTGQFIKGVGAIAKFLGIATLMTKEEAAAKFVTEAQTAAMERQTLATNTLSKETQVLAQSLSMAHEAAVARLEAEGLLTSSMAEEGAAAATAAERVAAAELEKQTAIERTTAAFMAQKEQAAAMASYGQFQPVVPPTGIKPRPVTPRSYLGTGFRGESIMAQEPAANVAARAAAAQAEAAALERNLATQAAIANKENARRAINEKIKGSVSGTGIATGVMAASMVTMMATSNHVAQNIAKWAMIGTIAVPAMKSLIGASAAMGAAMRTSISAARGGLVGTLGVMGTLTAGAKGFGAALNAALGPVGWIVLGLTAAAGVFMAIKGHNDKIAARQEALIKKQNEANKAMRDSAAAIAESMGKTAGSYQKISGQSGTAGTPLYSNSTLDAYNYYKGEGKKALGALDLTDQTALIDTVRKQFIDLQVVGKLTAKQAKDNLSGMLMAAGMSFVDASKMVEEVYQRMGDIKNIDWAGPLADQISAINNAAKGQLYGTEMKMTSSGAINVLTELDPMTIAKIKNAAKNAADVFQQALADAENPAEARRIIDQFMNGALTQWQVGFKNLQQSTLAGGDKVREVFAKYGVTSGKTFADAFRNNPEFKKAFEGLQTDMGVNTQLQAQLRAATLSGQTFEKTVVQQLAKSMPLLSDSITTAAQALAQFNAAAIGLTPQQAADNISRSSSKYREYQATLAQIKRLQENPNPQGMNRMIQLQAKLNALAGGTVKEINKVNSAYGFKQGRTAAEAMYNLTHHIKEEAKGAAGEAKNLDKALHQIPTMMTITIRRKEVGGIIRDAMSATQGDMADSALSSFDRRWDQSMATAQAGWDKRSENLQASQEAAQRRLEAGQEAAQRAFDARWESRKDLINKAYDKRIQGVKNEIEAEQKADKERQRIFEAEKARIERMAEMQNTNIDFNTALDKGNLDEAAKIQNNAGAKVATDQMDAEAKAAEERTQARIDSLEKKNERLEKERDREIKQLEKMEDRQKRHLERMQEARSRALEKAQKQETDALEKAEKSSMDSLEKRRDYDKAMLEQRLELFKSYTARNQKDLERWMRKVGLTYDDFGVDVKAKGTNWSQHFQTALSAHIRQAGVQVMNDNMWEKVGKEMAVKMLNGIGFKTMAEFNNFVRTGSKTGGKKGDSAETHHTGGVVGSGGGSRGNIPDTYKGLHRSEQMVRAQKGEYVVNRDAAKANMGLLHSINSGSYKGYDGVGGLTQTLDAKHDTTISTAGGGLGPAGLVAGLLARMTGAGINEGLKSAFIQAKTKWAKAGGAIYGGSAGRYGSASFDATQMKNAALIASVGSNMGMSKRDIEIGIMTSIAESSLRNLSGGDRDSAGLFQQRPSVGAWGTYEQITNPTHAATAFFSALRGVGDRGDLTPWAAAQEVQGSAFSDGSNYQPWWDEAQAIFNKGLAKRKGGGFTAGAGGSAGGGYIPGAGGRHRPISGPVTNGLHDTYTAFPGVDFAGPIGTPVKAVMDGIISKSYDIRGYEPRRVVYGKNTQDGYRSYGKVIQLKTDAGPSVLYAHLDKRSVLPNQRVKGGATLGYRGNTGHVVSYSGNGAHLHFGATNGPYAWLRKGGEVQWDNTKAVLHKGETVLTKPLTQQFKESVSNGGGDTFQVTLDLRGATIREDVDIKKAVNAAIDERENKIGRRRVVKSG